MRILAPGPLPPASRTTWAQVRRRPSSMAKAVPRTSIRLITRSHSGKPTHVDKGILDRHSSFPDGPEAEA